MKLLTIIGVGLTIGLTNPIYKSSDFTEKVLHTEDNKIINVGDSIVLGTPENPLDTKYRYVTDSIGNPHPYNSSTFKNIKYAIVALRKDEAIKVRDPNGKEWFFIWGKANEFGEVYFLPNNTSRIF